MPQIFTVLKCYECMIFQVHQAKRSNKWACKMCGEKQSIKKTYGIGAAKDCRLHVQRMNGIRGEIDGLKADLDDEIESSQSDAEEEKKTKLKKSKWSTYVEETNEVENEVPDNTNNGVEVVLEIPKKKKQANWRIPYNKNQQPAEAAVATPLTNNSLFHDKKGGSYRTAESCVTAVKRSKPNECLEKKIETSTFLIKNINEKMCMESQIQSKWDQFVEKRNSHCEEKGDKKEPVQESIERDVGSLFSLCDDQDIDGLLDF